jgi:hypothetical protein
MLSFRIERRGIRATLTACAVAVGMLAGTSQVASAYVPCPSGGTRSANVDSWDTLWPIEERVDPKGVTLCEGVGGILNNTRGYLQIADLGDGAKIRLHADVDPESPEAWLGEPDVLYRKRTADDWYSWLVNLDPEIEANWSYVRPDNERLFSVTNASFFSDTDNDNQTMMSFPLVTWGGMSTLGQAQREYEKAEPRRYDWEHAKKALLIGGEVYRGVQDVKVNSIRTRYEYEDLIRELMHVGGEEYSYDTLDAAVSFAPEVTVGESELRTYVGVYGDTVYIWVTDDEFTNAEASATMQEIQPGMEVIQMDGGGSSQFYSLYGEMDSNIPIADREVPSVLAIYRAGEGPIEEIEEEEQQEE